MPIAKRRRPIMPIDDLRIRVASLMERVGYDAEDLRRTTQVSRETSRRFLAGGALKDSHHHILDRWQARYS